jgi:hypothetical protein
MVFYSIGISGHL